MGIELQLAEVSWELQMRGQRISTAPLQSRACGRLFCAASCHCWLLAE